MSQDVELNALAVSLFGEVSCAEGAQVITEKIRVLETKLKGLYKVLQETDSVSGYQITEEKFLSLRKLYPFMTHVRYIDDRLVILMENICMEMVTGKYIDAVGNNGVLFVGYPLLSFLASTPLDRSIRFEVLTPKELARNNIIRERDIINSVNTVFRSVSTFDSKEIGNLIKTLQNTRKNTVVSNRSDYSHPHVNGVRDVFTNFCHGTNPFLSNLSRAKIKNVSDLVSAVIQMLLWVKSYNIDDSYGTASNPFIKNRDNSTSVKLREAEAILKFAKSWFTLATRILRTYGKGVTSNRLTKSETIEFQMAMRTFGEKIGITVSEGGTVTYNPSLFDPVKVENPTYGHVMILDMIMTANTVLTSGSHSEMISLLSLMVRKVHAAIIVAHSDSSSSGRVGTGMYYGNISVLYGALYGTISLYLECERIAIRRSPSHLIRILDSYQALLNYYGRQGLSKSGYEDDNILTHYLFPNQ